MLRQNNFACGIKKERSSPYLKIESDWPSYISQKSSKFRRTLRNKLNRVKKLKDFKIEKITNVNSEKSNIISDIIKVSRNSWKGKCMGDIARTRENEKFFKKLSIEASKNNWLNIWVLYAEADKPAAYQYHLIYKNKIYAMRSDYDENYKYYSPGCVLEKCVIKESMDEKLAEYDLCGNYYDYKMKWANSIREHMTYELFGFNIRSKLLYQFEYNALPVARKIGLNRFKNAIFKKNENY
jgi:CelD/BcsL family acetyltransferase involved in cellulose biosynthesis